MSPLFLFKSSSSSEEQGWGVNTHMTLKTVCYQIWGIVIQDQYKSVSMSDTRDMVTQIIVSGSKTTSINCTV